MYFYSVSKEELFEENTVLSTENRELKTEVILLKEENAQLKKIIFGAKRERFEGDQNPTQTSLFPDQNNLPSQEDQTTTTSDNTTSSDIPKKKKKARKVSKRNSFPAHLKRETTILLPQHVDAENLSELGRDITEILAYQPASIYVKEIIRPRLSSKSADGPGVLQAPIPPRIVPRGMVDESLIAEMISEKIQFHTPVHRFSKKLKQLGVTCISNNNLYNWFHKAAEALIPVYDLLVADIIAQGYIQGDETRMQVLSKNKPGASHRGQMWAFMAPTIKAIAFNYEPTRSEKSACVILEKYEGILQVDGYSAYETLVKTRPIQLIYCMAHSRRKFFDALTSSGEIAKYFLKKVQKLYEIERRCRSNNLTFQQRLKVRKKEAVPILKNLEEWLSKEMANPNLLPKNLLYKALFYTHKRWQGLSAYAHDGQLEIDNNWVENTIRPIALGRKNYLFAGSDSAAQNLAVLYSLVNTCTKNKINVYTYLHWLLKKVAANKVTPQAIDWLPHRINPKILEDFEG